MSCKLLNTILTGAALACLALTAEKPGTPTKYQAYLSPMPHNDAMHADFAGKGNVVATLTGDTLSLSGAFSGLASPAMKAVICTSMAAGIPGKPLFEFVVPSAVDGSLTGTFNLDKNQASMFQKGQLYIQINSEKAPSGNLWGWLLPEHEVAGQDVPQKGPWFLPEFAVKTK